MAARMKTSTLGWIAGGLFVVWLVSKKKLPPPANWQPTFVQGTNRLNSLQMAQMPDGSWQVSYDSGNNWAVTAVINGQPVFEPTLD